MRHKPAQPWLGAGRSTNATKSAAAGLYPAASYISSRYGDSERGLDSDGLVARCDAQIPNAVVVNAAFENDHADCTFPAKHPEDMARIHADGWASPIPIASARRCLHPWASTSSRRSARSGTPFPSD